MRSYKQQQENKSNVEILKGIDFFDVLFMKDRLIGDVITILNSFIEFVCKWTEIQISHHMSWVYL